MTKKILSVSSVFFIAAVVFAQDITRQDADSLTQALKAPVTREKRIELLLNLAQYHVFKPGEYKADLDSAATLVEQAINLNKTEKSSDAHGYELLTQSYIEKERGHAEESKLLLENAIAILKEGNNPSYLGRAYFAMSAYYGFRDSAELETKIGFVREAAKAFNQSTDLAMKARTLEMVGDLLIRQDHTGEAISTLNEALAAYAVVRNAKVQGVYTLLGEAFLARSNFGEALIELQKALQTCRAVGDTSMRLCQINNILGALYWHINRKELSVRYKEDALATASKYNDAAAIFVLAISISVNYVQLNQPQSAFHVLSSIPKSFLATLDPTNKVLLGLAYIRVYVLLEDYNKAIATLRTVVPIAMSKKVDYQLQAATYRLASATYYYVHDYTNARYFMKKNRDIQSQHDDIAGQIEDAKVWYKLDSAQGDFRSAFNFMSFLKTKTDSILSESRIRQLQVLEVEYKTQIKEDSIKAMDKDILFLKQTNSLQQSNLRQARLIRNITLVGVCLACLVIGLLYRQYAHKQKTNRIISHKNQQLQSYLKEKEWLLKEIHHRVKNNLQIVMSLLNSQSAYIDNASALAAIHDSTHRVHSMSLIHQKLYNSDDLSSIDASVYTRELVSYLSDSFSMGQRVRFDVSADSFYIDVSQAVPVGLILNEAITNAIKYAFPGNRTGVISITVNKTADDECVVIISDNGVGMPLHVRQEKTRGLGMTLIAGLTEDLEGALSMDYENGTTIRIVFPYKSGRPQTVSAYNFVD